MNLHRVVPVAPELAMQVPAVRPLRGFVLPLCVALASGVALAAWSATTGLPGVGDVMVPQGPLLDRLLADAQASPIQSAQAHQIFDAADIELRGGRRAERVDHDRLARLLSLPQVDASGIEAVRARIEQRHDAESRRATQALIDVSLVLNARQRQTLASQLASGPRPFAGFRPQHAASAVND